MNYFGNGSSTSNSENGHFCVGGGVYSTPEPKEDKVRLAKLVPIIHASESREGLQAPPDCASWTKGQDRPKSSEPTRLVASRKMKQTEWIDLSYSNPFPDQRNTGSVVKIGSPSFDSHAPSDEASTVDELMPPTRQMSRGMSNIHLLEIEEAENEEEEEITQFEC